MRCGKKHKTAHRNTITDGVKKPSSKSKDVLAALH
eukprot:COSAG02_NODE_61237_length_269_cov_0.611765_1_plen_34_part_10